MTGSLHKRINLGSIGFAVALLVGLIILETFFIQQIAQYYVSTRLEHDNETILSALTVDPNSQSYTLKENLIHPIYQRPFSGHYFKLSLPSQTIRSRSLWDEVLNISMEQPHYPKLTTIIGPYNEPLLVLIERYEMAEQDVIIATAESMAQLQPLTRQAQFWSAGAACILVLIFMIFQYRWIRSSLEPLKSLKSQLKELQQGKRKQLNLDNVFSELSPLITELNQLLLALDERITRSRHAMGNLAHALKTPMASLQQLSEEDAADDPNFMKKMATILSTINHRVDNELKRARIAGAKGSREQINIRDEIIDLNSTLRKIYSSKDIQSHISIPANTYITFDRQDFLEMVGNVLDNGFKWASRKVEIAVSCENGLKIVIEDDGPGCDENQLALLSERGKRLDESTPGHGLGLSIVKDIVSQYNGVIEFKKGEEGGLRVEITIAQ